MSAQAEVYEERVWLKRAVLVLVRPREVLSRLRDDSDDAARARGEALLALIWLAGIAGVLWTPVGGKVLNDVTLDWVDILVWAFIGGGLYGLAVYGEDVFRSGGSDRGSGNWAFVVLELAVLAWSLALLLLGLRLARSNASSSSAGIS